MATVHEIVQYLSGCTNVFRTQAGLLPEKLVTESVKSMASTITRHIRALRVLDADGASALNSAISESTFPPAEKTAFATAVIQRLTAPVAEAGADSSKQTMTHPYNYPTESDWTYIRDKSKSLQQVCVRVRERLRLVGLINIGEKTFTALASMIAAAREPDMSSIALKAVVDELKQVVLGHDVPPVQVRVFPPSAMDLPQALIDRAYGQEPPCPQDFPDFKTIVKRCPARNSHRSLRTSPALQSRHGWASTGFHPASMEPMARAMMPFIEGAMSTFASQMLGPDRRVTFVEQGQQAVGSSGDGLTIFAGGNQPHQRTQLVPRDPRLQSALPDGIQGDMTANDEDHPLVQMDVPDISGADARPAQDIVDEMERIACGDKHDVSKGALYKKPDHCTVALKRPSAATAVCTPVYKKKPSGKSFKLGCSRCKDS